MGTIDEAYTNNNNDNEQSSSELVNGTKLSAMIPSPVPNHTVTAPESAKDESLGRLKYESMRLLTFDKWPASAKVEPRKIAKAGFFYTGQYAEAKCLWCDCVITTWEYGDQVMTRHRSASPDCPFVRDVSDNIPLLASTTSSNNIMSPLSEEPHINNESDVDRVDYGPHNNIGINENTDSVNSNMDTYNDNNDGDEVGSHIEPYSNRRLQDTRRMSSPRPQNDTRASIVSERISPPQRTSGGDWRHPNSGRRLSGDFMNRPTINTLMSPDINDDVYKYESERLKTFDAWPISFIRPADLANAGFVYTGRGDCVRCVFCREHVGDWDEDDFPHTEHRALFPHCPFVRGLDVGNVAVSAENRGIQERLGLVHSQSQHANLSSRRDDLSREMTPNRSNDQRPRRNSSNIQTRTDLTGNTRLRPSSGRSSTSYQRQHSDQPQRPRSTSYDNYTPFDRNFMELSSRPQAGASSSDMMEESYDEAGIRPRTGGPEKGVLHLMNTTRGNKQDGGGNKRNGASSSATASGQPEDLGIIRHSGPANPKYSTVEARTRTFREWPPALRQQPAQLSEAGFFYIGLSDQVKCFYCDGGLRNWQPEDDPWTEHSRWFSECGFVRLVKGDEFISKCINSHPPVPVQGVPVVSRDRSRNAVSETELQQMMSSPLVHQVLAMGIDSTRVKKALKQRIQETGSGFKFASELVEATLMHGERNPAPMSYQANQGASLLGAGPMIPSTSTSTSNPPVPSHPQPHHPESQILSNTVSPYNPTADTSIILPSGNPSTHRESSTLNLPSDSSSRTCSSAPGTLETRNTSESGVMESSPMQPGQKETNLGDPSIDLEVENRRLKDQRTCKICMDREIGVVFLTCGHLISCVQCAPALKDCPLCRQTIVGTVKTYMS